ncbi:hypothetical protein ACJX0J_008984, partial [Zea mays]
MIYKSQIAFYSNAEVAVEVSTIPLDECWLQSLCVASSSMLTDHLLLIGTCAATEYHYIYASVYPAYLAHFLSVVFYDSLASSILEPEIVSGDQSLYKLDKHHRLCMSFGEHEVLPMEIKDAFSLNEDDRKFLTAPFSPEEIYKNFFRISGILSKVIFGICVMIL